MSFQKDVTSAQRLRHLNGWQAGQMVRPVIVAEIQHQTIRRRPTAQSPVRQEVIWAMSLFTLDQILETDRFVIEELFELSMNEPELSQEFQSFVQDPWDNAQSYSV